MWDRKCVIKNNTKNEDRQTFSCHPLVFGYHYTFEAHMPLVCMNWAQLEVLACMFKFVTSRLDTWQYLLRCSGALLFTQLFKGLYIDNTQSGWIWDTLICSLIKDLSWQIPKKIQGSDYKLFQMLSCSWETVLK